MQMRREPGHCTVEHFALTNPVGQGMDNIPRLLRRLAVNISSLGTVEILDITFHTELTSDGPDSPMFVVYYIPRKRKPRGASTVEAVKVNQSRR